MKKGLVGALFLLLIFCVAGCSSASETTPTAASAPTASAETQETKEARRISQEMIKLESEGLGFGTGTFERGAIPAGEYVFLVLSEDNGYYEEDDASGSILANQNFDSFGYVTVNGAGNVKIRGALISANTMSRLGVSGAKELYEKLHYASVGSGYNQSGIYKVGADISEGTHTIKSLGGSGYYAVLSGPVGKNEIIINDNLSGSATVELMEGQYLELRRTEYK